MLRRVAPVEDLKNTRLSRDLEHMTNWELVETSLSTLSKTLGQSLSATRTVAVYCKWLESHRQAPSDLTRNWDNTLLHWSQALKARGIDKDWLINAVEEWRAENSPFLSTPYMWGQQRCFPVPADIARAWVEEHTMQYQIPVLDSGKERPYTEYHHQRQNFEGIPPGDYVCNRCYVSGHFLQACPTNMDPSFDKAPDMDYQCSICHKYGLHYKSICPLNFDPFCISQKRRNVGVETPDEFRSGIIRNWHGQIGEHGEDDFFRCRPLTWSWGLDSEENTYRLSPSWSTGDNKVNISSNFSPNYSLNTSKSSETMERIKETDDMKMRIVQSDSVETADVLKIRNVGASNRASENPTRVSSPDGSKICSRRECNEKSPSPTKDDTLRKKLRQIEFYEAYVAKGKELDRNAKAMIEKKSVYQAQLNSLESNFKTDVMDRDSRFGAEMEGSSSLAVRQNAPSPKRSMLSYHHCQKSSSSPGDIAVDCRERRESNQKIMSHSEFVMKLTGKHPEMKNVVNLFRRRKTAADMWDEDDDRRMEMLGVSQATNPPLFGPFDSDYDYDPTAIELDQDNISME